MYVWKTVLPPFDRFSVLSAAYSVRGRLLLRARCRTGTSFWMTVFIMPLLDRDRRNGEPIGIIDMGDMARGPESK